MGLSVLLLVAAGRFATVRRAGSVRATAIAALVGVTALGLMIWITMRHGRDALSVASWFLIVALSLVVALLVAAVREAVRVIADNDYGLVGGTSHDTEPGSVEPLSEWLDSLVQGLAGKQAGAPPLTFGELVRLGPDGAPSEDGVNLTILTTCISRGRTYYLPHDFDADDPGDRFWFDPDKLQTTPLEARGKPLTRTFASVGGGT